MEMIESFCSTLTASAQILIPNLVRVHNMEAIRCALWRDVDMSSRTQRSGSYPEHVLFVDPFDDGFGYLIIVLGHGCYAAKLRARVVIRPPKLTYSYM
jgi:hypothetical protein